MVLVASVSLNGIDRERMPFLHRYAGWAAIAIIAILSLAPPHLRPHLLPIGQLEHLAAYAVIGALLAAINRKPRTLVSISIALPAFAAALEIAQIWTPGRDPKFSDFAAGALGAWIGMALVIFALGFRDRAHTKIAAKPAHHRLDVAPASAKR